MTATNVNIEDLVSILIKIHNSGIKLVDLDMLPDEDHPSMNKLVIYPVKASYDPSFDRNNHDNQQQEDKNPSVRDPRVSTDNNDIFNLFNGIL